MRKKIIAAAIIMVLSRHHAHGQEIAVFYGDGVHDDAPALEAAARGDLVAVENDGVGTFKSEPGALIIYEKRVLLCQPVDMSKIRFAAMAAEFIFPAGSDDDADYVFTIGSNYYIGGGPRTVETFFPGDPLKFHFSNVNFNIVKDACGRTGWWVRTTGQTRK